jgi:hypothetical protein
MLSPHIRLKLLNQSSNFALALRICSILLSIDPMQSSNIHVVTCVGSKDDAKHVAAKEVKQQLKIRIKEYVSLHDPTNIPRS